MDKVLIDTDVILDFFLDRKPFSEFAAGILTLCDKKIITGFTTPVICSNTYYMLRHTASHEIVIEKLTQLLTILNVLIIDKDVVLQSLRSKFKDFEDALQHYAAVQQGDIDVILTRNTKDFKNSTIGVETPENYLKTIIL